MANVLVIGGGAAGLLAGIAAAQNGAKTVILEKMRRPGKKILITGKGRCNITNNCDLQEIIKNIPGNGRFLNSALRRFTNQDIVQLLEDNGLPTKVERGGRVFPVSDKAADVVDTLVKIYKNYGGRLLTDCKVKSITAEFGKITGAVTANGQKFTADAVILAAGGASYPGTGSDGSGVKLAKALGHTIVPLAPSLVPLESDSPYIAGLQGLSLRNIEGTVYADGKKIGSEFGEMLFTHFGVSGPIILSLSKCVAEAFAKGAQEVELAIDLKPALDKDKLDARLQRDFTQYSRKQMPNGMKDLLPQRLIAPVLDQAFIDEEKFVNQLSRAERRRLVDVLKAFTVPITGTRPIAEAIVTAGGVSLKEIDPKTMESKLIKGLFFAGEVMDIDGYTGGYNLQAAFSTGYAAGTFCRTNIKTGGDKMNAQKPVIAIDGPAGAGKSTIAKLVAGKLGYIYIDTGAMYRSVAWKFLQTGKPFSPELVEKLAQEMVITFKPEANANRVFVDGTEVTEAIRSPEVTAVVSKVSAVGGVRAEMVNQQRRMGEAGGVVMDGRDIGTVVFPHAQVKIFLTASVKERAMRRYKEMLAKGEKVDLAELEKQIAFRDKQDSEREIAPLKQADDAEFLDTSDMTIDEVAEHILKAVQEK